MLDRNERLAALHETAMKSGVQVQMTDRRAMKGMCDTETPQGVVGVALEPEWDRDEVINCRKPLLILDQIRDPGNLGVMLRTAEAAGAGGLFLLKGSVELLNPKVVRATAGSIFRFPVLTDQRPDSLIDDLKRAGVTVFATDVKGKLFSEMDYSKPHAFLLGNEAFGIDPDVLAKADQTISIPMEEPVNSLNVAVATGILLYAKA
jgi:TrmH family RNA methyltransferase